MKEGFLEVSGKIGLLKILSPNGKMCETNCATTETMFRIIQAIPSPKAEPLKRWLARVDFERVEEIENPELATKRTRAIYKAKGYSYTWIEKRMHGIEVRETLTDEWEKHGVREVQEYALQQKRVALLQEMRERNSNLKVVRRFPRTKTTCPLHARRNSSRYANHL